MIKGVSRFLFLFLLASVNIPVSATNSIPGTVVVSQPDGTLLTIILKGDEFIHYAVSVDGYTLLSDKNGYYVYATRDNSGNLILSDIRAHDPGKRKGFENRFLRKTEKQLFFSRIQVEQMRARQFPGLNKSPAMTMQGGFPKAGTRKLLQILANFSNTTTSFAQSDFQTLMNQQGYNSTGSFRDYFLEVSYGQLTINTTVTVWVTLPNPHDYYGPVSKWQEFAFDAIAAANTQTNTDFSEFDNDNDGLVEGVMIIHQGTGQEASANPNDIWAHKWDLSSAGYTEAQRTFDGVLLDVYGTGPELLISGTMTQIGVLCHEFGHVMGSPDFYDTDQALNGQYEGTGLWDLMGSGNWNGVYGTLPAHPNAWIKNYFNWTNPNILSNQQTQLLRNAQQYPDVIRYNSYIPTIYFLCENRQQTGFDAGLPGHGMIIYYVDSLNIVLNSDINRVNNNQNQYLHPMSAISTTANGVMLSPGNINTDGCPWPGSSSKTTFTDFTIPNSIVEITRNTVKPLLNITEDVSLKEVSFCFLSCTPDGLGSFSATPNGTDKIDLAWTNNSNNDPVLIAYSFYPFIETPVPSVSYTIGNILSFYSQVIFVGTGTTFQHAGVNANTTYYYSAWSILPGNDYSYTLTATSMIHTTMPACPGIPSMTVNHSIAGGVAPVDKTVLYETVTNILGEPNKCWITSNLGSNHQADSIDDPTEASAGWYWQFDHKQGYMHNGTARIPGSVWNSSIMTNDDWSLENDPCTLELGTPWRIPTGTEWMNLENGGHWRYGQGYWYSGLKLHFAGYLSMNNVFNYNGGDLISRGNRLKCWSKSNIGINYYGAWMLSADYIYCQVDAGSGNYPAGLSLRCVRESPALPTITTAAVGNITGIDATSGGNVTNDGGLPITLRGVCWSLLSNPTVANDHSTDGSGPGTFTSIISGLTPMTTYHVRAYATNNVGTAYGNDIEFMTGWGCGLPLNIDHQVSGGVAPVNKQTTYGTVNNIPGEPNKCWITSNLGSDHQATAVEDDTEASAGWYWQFNRKQGYKHEGTSRTPNTPWITSIFEHTDWEIANDPCRLELGIGWRIPTFSEWLNVDESGNWTTRNDSWNSELKLHSAGFLNHNDGTLTSRGIFGLLWSNKGWPNGFYGYYIYFDSDFCDMYGGYKSNGIALRCLNDNCITYSNINVSIFPSSNPVCAGTPVTFTATVVNGGSTPSYQWYVNAGSITDATNSVFTYAPQNNDSVTCVITSTLPCVSSNPQTSDTLVMTVNPNPVVRFDPCMDIVTTTDSRPYQLKGGLPRGGTYTGPGVNSLTGLFTPSSAGTGLKNIDYSYINHANCEAFQSLSILVLSPSPFFCGTIFTDPRDNQSYPTYSLPGGQCWMAANLNYGNFIPDHQFQSDDCSPEKYCLENLQPNCGIYGGFYQWDELMQYDSVQGVQGLCPPGWHIPDSGEWMNLILQNSGNGIAGFNLKNLSTAAGFHGIPSGFYYQNHSWVGTNPLTSGSMFWTSTTAVNQRTRAVARGINEATQSSSEYSSLKSNAFQIRCVKN